jgi:hypothetical protein
MASKAIWSSSFLNMRKNMEEYRSGIMANFKDHRSRESQEGVSAIHRPENCMVIA